MEPWLIAAGAAVLLITAAVVGYFVFVGPSDVAKGRAEDNAEDKARADGLQVGADAVQKMADAASKAAEAQAAAQKQRDPVDVANEAIKRRLMEKEKKPW